MADPIIIYTDGAASGNPGPGGFGVVLKAGVYRKELMAGFRRTTNNRMELLAVNPGGRWSFIRIPGMWSMLLKKAGCSDGRRKDLKIRKTRICGNAFWLYTGNIR